MYIAGLVAEWNRAQVRDGKRRPTGKLQDKYTYFYNIYIYVICMLKLYIYRTVYADDDRICCRDGDGEGVARGVKGL